MPGRASCYDPNGDAAFAVVRDFVHRKVLLSLPAKAGSFYRRFAAHEFKTETELGAAVGA